MMGACITLVVYECSGSLALMISRDIITYLVLLLVVGSGIAFYQMNDTVRSEPMTGTVVSIGTATSKYLANAPVLTVHIPDGREVAVVYPAERPLPALGESVNLTRRFNRFFGDGFFLAP